MVVNGDCQTIRPLDGLARLFGRTSVWPQVNSAARPFDRGMIWRRASRNFAKVKLSCNCTNSNAYSNYVSLYDAARDSLVEASLSAIYHAPSDLSFVCVV